jgi:ABC-type uncharacterized transport system auxiliary subunit
MKLRNYMALGLISALLLGCGQQAATTQTPESPVAESPAVSTTTNQAETTTAQASTEQKVLKSGRFVSGEHPTEGTVQVVDKGGKRIIQLDKSFKTFDMGPDLVVILHRSDNVLSTTKPPAYSLKEGDYVFIDELQKFSGAQTYEIPANVNLDEYKSVAIWCRKFNATFGAAKLST